jgi:hypothetical protein
MGRAASVNKENQWPEVRLGLPAGDGKRCTLLEPVRKVIERFHGVVREQM